jgi:hypothetical protein
LVQVQERAGALKEVREVRGRCAGSAPSAHAVAVQGCVGRPAKTIEWVRVEWLLAVALDSFRRVIGEEFYPGLQGRGGGHLAR